MRLSLVVSLGLACAPPTIEVKDRVIATDVATRVDSTSLCSGAPFGRGTVDFAKDLAEAGIDLSLGCLRSGSFELSAEYGEVRPGQGCATATGTAYLTGVLLEATCSVPGMTKATLRATCQSNALAIADGTQVFLALNACLDEFERTQTEPVRALINSCKPTALTVTAEGYCSADLCFSANVRFGLKTKNVVAQLGGTCP